MSGLILSPLVSIVRDNNKVFLFHRVNLIVIECDEDTLKLLSTKKFESNGKNISGSMNLLKSKEILVEKNFDVKKYYSDIQDEIKKTKVRINRYRIVLTEKCNYNCKYCFVNLSFKDSEWENIMKSLDLLIKENDSKEITIQFFGGEPLIRFDLIKKIVAYLKDYGKTLKNVRYYLTTNGSLIDDEKAEFFKENNFNVGVSLDGPKKLNDSNRILKNGKGTYEMSMKGFNKLKKNGVNNFILVTPSNSNLGKLDHICNYLIEKLKPNAITINMPQHNYGWGIDGKVLSDKMKKIVLLCAKKRVKLTSPASQIFVAIKNKSPVLRTCSSTFDTASLSVTVDGRFSYCPINFDKDLFKERIGDNQNLDFDGMQKWFSNTSLNDEVCRKCIAVATCGGACPMQSLEKHPNKKSFIHDHEKCKFFKDFTTWSVVNF